jgi:hypothetical protein
VKGDVGMMTGHWEGCLRYKEHSPHEEPPSRPIGNLDEEPKLGGDRFGIFDEENCFAEIVSAGFTDGLGRTRSIREDPRHQDRVARWIARPDDLEV